MAPFTLIDQLRRCLLTALALLLFGLDLGNAAPAAPQGADAPAVTYAAQATACDCCCGDCISHDCGSGIACTAAQCGAGVTLPAAVATVLHVLATHPVATLPDFHSAPPPETPLRPPAA